MKKILAPIFWFFLALLGAWAYATIAFKRGEPRANLAKETTAAAIPFPLTSPTTIIAVCGSMA